MSEKSQKYKKYFKINGEIDDPIVKVRKISLYKIYQADNREAARILFLQEFKSYINSETGEFEGRVDIKEANDHEVNEFYGELGRSRAVNIK